MRKFLLSFSTLLILLLVSCAKDSDNLAAENGTGGSLARFVLVDEFLYVIDASTLSTYNVLNAAQPTLVNTQPVDFGIETLYPYEQYLLIGSTRGMFIYERGADGVPVFLSSFEHFEACDPVVTDGEYAYVTLRNTSICGNFAFGVNRMEVVSIANPRQPQLVNVINMPEPKGLALDGDFLFVCAGNEGIYVFDKSDAPNPVLMTTIPGFTANDVITRNNTLLAVCPDGLRQFDYSDIDSILQISYYPVNF